jgi:ADP-dependent NAD(P)H-hydrate dehydratase / NAD(P)H-hydrate epimerase
MISIVTPDTMRALEQTVMDDGVSVANLIQRAAVEIAEYIDRRMAGSSRRNRSVVAVAGPGNNGVDAIVAASLLVERGWDASVYLVGRSDLSEHPELADHLARLVQVDEIPQVDLILDGIFGNSGRTELPDAATRALDQIRRVTENTSTVVLAIDCPTGTNTLTGEVAEHSVRADITLCISNPKIGMLKLPASGYLGELVVLDIGIRSGALDPLVNAAMIDESDVRKTLPQRDPGAHKSQVGGLLVVGGAPGYYGAPRLAGEAALRAGCGYVGLAIPRSIVGAIASAVPELIYHPLSDSDGRNSASIVGKAVAGGSRYDAIVIGPGLGRDEVATRFLSEMFEANSGTEKQELRDAVFGIPRRAKQPDTGSKADITSYPLVLDADALNWLSGLEDWQSRLDGRTCVLTPHVGEMARLLDVEPEIVADDPWTIARQAAQDWNQVVVLKHRFSCVATPSGELFVAPRMTPELATPGTGDVLAGLIGAIISQGGAPAAASAIALYIGAQAGAIARLRLGTRSVIARDVIESLGSALMAFDSPALRRFSAI